MSTELPQASSIWPARKKRRLDLDPEEDDGSDEPANNNEVLHYKTCAQFKEVTENSDFPAKLRLPCNKEIIHEICKNTLHFPLEQIEGRKKAIHLVISRRRALLNVKTGKDENSVLHHPNIHLELLKFLIENGSRVDAKTKCFEQTFLHLSATYLNPDMFHELVNFLVEEMLLADLLREVDVDRATPLHVAVYNMEVKAETISMFRNAAQVGLNDVDRNGDNVLSYAVQGRRNEAYLKFLLRLGASGDGTTLALHAVGVGNIDAIRVFGAVAVTDFHPKAVAEKSILHRVLGGFNGRDLTEAALHETVKTLLNCCEASALLQDEKGRTPLWLAVNGPLKDNISTRTLQLLLVSLAEEQVKLKPGTSSDLLPSTAEEGSWPPIPIDISLQDIDDLLGCQRPSDNDNTSTEEGSRNEIPSRIGDSPQSAASINMEDTVISDEGQGPRSDKTQKELILSPQGVTQEPEVRSNQTEYQLSKEAVPENCRDDNSVSPTPGPSRRQNTGATTQEVAPMLHKDDEIHRLVSYTSRCSKGAVQKLKRKLEGILEANPELLNKALEDEEGTPILCLNVHIDLLKLMISKGADPSATTKTDNQTVLHLAAQYLDPSSFHQLVLLVQKEDPNVLNAVDSEGRNALHLAVLKFEVRKETLNIFAQCGFNFHLCDSDRENLLSYALEGGRRKPFIMALYNEYGVRPVKNRDGVTLVHQAAQVASLELMKLMIELSPEDVIALDDDNSSPLHYAVAVQQKIKDEHVRKVRALLNDFKVKDHLSEGPMRNLVHTAVSYSSRCNQAQIKLKKKIIAQLLTCDGTLLNEEWEHQATPLECENVHLELLKFLISRGCDPCHRWGDNGQNYVFLHGMEHLSPEDYHSLVQFLMSRNFGDVLTLGNRIGTTPIHDAVSEIELDAKTIEVFRKVTDLNHEDIDGWNVLMYAVEGGRSLHFIQMLMEKGVEVKSAKDNTTVAHLAAKTGNMELLEFFLNRNPRLAREANDSGKTPLHFAVENVKGDGKRLDLVDLLLYKFNLPEGAIHLPKVCNVLDLCVNVTRGEKSEDKIGEMKEIVRKLVRWEPSLHKFLNAPGEAIHPELRNTLCK